MTTENNNLGSARKAITPVIAIVLLLMMTVAAAGGAYAWLTQLQDQFQDRAGDELERGIDITDLQCYNEDSEAVVEVFFSNSGTKELDLNPVDMNIRSADTENINYTLTRTGLSLTDGDLSDDVSIITGSSDFSESRASAAYNITNSEMFVAGDRYEVEFVFTDEDSETVTSACQAEAE